MRTIPPYLFALALISVIVGHVELADLARYALYVANLYLAGLAVAVVVDKTAAKAIDTTGAGDAFAAAFVAARLGGDEVEACLRKAVAAGAAATIHLGGRASEFRMPLEAGRTVPAPAISSD